jgi:hypothetical protein
LSKDISEISARLLNTSIKIISCIAISNLRIFWLLRKTTQNCAILVLRPLSNIGVLCVALLNIWLQKWSKKSHMTTRSIYGDSASCYSNWFKVTHPFVEKQESKS